MLVLYILFDIFKIIFNIKSDKENVKFMYIFSFYSDVLQFIVLSYFIENERHCKQSFEINLSVATNAVQQMYIIEYIMLASTYFCVNLKNNL